MGTRVGVRRYPRGRPDPRSFAVGESVEVRQHEPGLKGSWHPGVVVDMQFGCRLVQYDELLTDDGQSNLKETVNVKEIVDGRKRGPSRMPWRAPTTRARELIRPKPPVGPDPSSVSWDKGLCVDCFCNDAWWEGILTEPVGAYSSNKRVWVWFPEERDWEVLPLHKLRVGQQWDETKGLWKVKGIVNLSIPRRETRAKASSSSRTSRPRTRSTMPDDMQLAVSLNISQAGNAGRERKSREVRRTEIMSEEQENGLPYAGVADASRRKKRPSRTVKNFQLGNEAAHQNEVQQNPSTLNPSTLVLRTRSLDMVAPRAYISSGGRGCEEAWPSDSTASGSGENKSVVHKIDHSGFLVSERPLVVAGKENLATEKLASCFDRTNDRASADNDALQQCSVVLPSIPECIPAQSSPVGNETLADAGNAPMVSRALETRSKKRAYVNGGAGGDANTFLNSVNRSPNRDEVMDREPRQKKSRIVADEISFPGGKDKKFSTPFHEGLRSKSYTHQYNAELSQAKASSRTRGYFPHQDGEVKQGKKGRTTMKGVGFKNGSKSRAAPRGGVTLEVILSPDNRSGTSLAEGELHRKRTMLSWLIDNGTVIEKEPVRYLHKKDRRCLLEGFVTRDGILCNCCNRVVTLSAFEAHAGSKLHRPSANIFLQDGRSLSICQKEALESRDTADSQNACVQQSSNDASDDTCGICGDGGNLVCCDNCPSTFHISCMGLEGVPDGEWYCVNCRCASCGESQFIGDPDTFNDFTVIFCDQCECKYHVKCLRSRGMELTACPQGEFFCTAVCERIHRGLRELVGSCTQMEGGFSWTLLRSQAEDERRTGRAVNEEISAEHDSKLSIALNVMRECFSPMTDPRTSIDIISHVLYNRRSDVTRLNFMGFYTMLLERGDELISVATVRVHGKKLAELPLVGTRFQYRRQGMCRRLMSAIQVMLHGLGVERIVLPAVPELESTWTGPFGFRHMQESEKLQLMDMNIMAFPGTAILYKQLDNVGQSWGEALRQTVERVTRAVAEQSGLQVRNATMLPSPRIIVKRGRGRPPKIKGQVTNLRHELTVLKSRKLGKAVRSAKAIEQTLYCKAVTVKRGRGRPPKNKDALFKSDKNLKVSTSMALVSRRDLTQQDQDAGNSFSTMPSTLSGKAFPVDARNLSNGQPGDEPLRPSVRRKRGRPPRARSNYSSSIGILSLAAQINQTEDIRGGRMEASTETRVGNTGASERLPSLRRPSELRRFEGEEGAEELGMSRSSQRTTRSKQEERRNSRSLASGIHFLNSVLPVVRAVASGTRTYERRKIIYSPTSESDTNSAIPGEESDNEFICGTSSSFVEHVPQLGRPNEQCLSGPVTVPVRSYPKHFKNEKFGPGFVIPVETVVVHSGYNNSIRGESFAAHAVEVSDPSSARTRDEGFDAVPAGRLDERADGVTDEPFGGRLDEQFQGARERLDDQVDESLDEPLGGVLINGCENRGESSSEIDACDQTTGRKLVLKVKHPQRKEVSHVSDVDAIQLSAPAVLVKGDLIPPSSSITDQMQDVARFDEQPESTISSSRCIQVAV